MKEKILQFLYEQVQSNKIPQIKKGMVEEFEAFINSLIAEEKAGIMANRVMAEQLKAAKDNKKGESDEEAS